jgi:hypothetical protein
MIRGLAIRFSSTPINLQHQRGHVPHKATLGTLSRVSLKATLATSSRRRQDSILWMNISIDFVRVVLVLVDHCKRVFPSSI